MADEPAILSQPAVGIRAGVEDVIDDHRQDRHPVLSHRVGESQVDRGVLQRRQAPSEHGLGKCPDQVATARCDGAGPLLIRQASRSVALIEGVQPGVEPVAEHEGPATDRVRNRSVFTLRIAGHIDTPVERKRPRVQRLRQRGLARADDPGQHDIRRGDQAAGVQHPRVVDERPPAVEILANEHAIGTQTAFGHERIRPRQRRGRVLMPGQPEPARRPQRRWTGLTRPRQERGLSPLGPLPLSFHSRGREFGLALLGVQPGLGSAALLPQPAAFLRRSNQNSGVQPLPLAHSDNPRRPASPPAAGLVNQSQPAGPALRRGGAALVAVVVASVAGPTVNGVSMPRSAGSGSAVASR